MRLRIQCGICGLECTAGDLDVTNDRATGAYRLWHSRCGHLELGASGYLEDDEMTIRVKPDGPGFVPVLAPEIQHYASMSRMDPMIYNPDFRGYTPKPASVELVISSEEKERRQRCG